MYVGKTRSPILILVFFIITCGIYPLYWYYTITNDLNKVLNEERLNPVLLLILSIFCPPIVWYTLYKIDQGLCEVSTREGISYKENFILWLLLTFVFGVGIFVSIFQITNAYNQIWEMRSGGTSVPPKIQ